MLKKTIAKRIQNPFRKRKFFTASAWLNWPSKAMVAPNTTLPAPIPSCNLAKTLYNQLRAGRRKENVYSFFSPFFFFEIRKRHGLNFYRKIINHDSWHLDFENGNVFEVHFTFSIAEYVTGFNQNNYDYIRLALDRFES